MNSLSNHSYVWPNQIDFNQIQPLLTNLHYQDNYPIYSSLFSLPNLQICPQKILYQNTFIPKEEEQYVHVHPFWDLMNLHSCRLSSNSQLNFAKNALLSQFLNGIKIRDMTGKNTEDLGCISSLSFKKEKYDKRAFPFEEKDILFKKIKGSKFIQKNPKYPEQLPRQLSVQAKHNLFNKKTTGKEPEINGIKRKAITQSRWKNIPGHIMFAIQRGCQHYFRKYTGIKIDCLESILKNESKEKQEKFKAFIIKYERVWRTWSSILSFINKEGDEETIEILIKLISGLLSIENESELDKWFAQTKLSKKTKELIISSKELFKKEFIERITSIKTVKSE